MPTNSTNQQNVQPSFLSFYDGWLRRQKNLLDRLRLFSTLPDSSPTEIDDQNKLIESVLAHYQQYLEEKKQVADKDVFLLFSPTWLSPYERALLWIGDFRPSLILRIAEGAAEEDLTTEQRKARDRIGRETMRSERELSAAMASVQESVASPRVLGMARIAGRELDGEIEELDEAVEMLKRALYDVFERADELRAETVRKLIMVLTPPQTVRFLAAAMDFQLTARQWGSESDG